VVEHLTSNGAIGEGNRRWDGVKFGELVRVMATTIPSQAQRWEGVETWRHPPKANLLWWRESPDCKLARGDESRGGTLIKWSMVRSHPGSPHRCLQNDFTLGTCLTWTPTPRLET